MSQICTSTEERPYGDRERTIYKTRSGLRIKLVLLTPGTWTCNLQNCEKINFYKPPSLQYFVWQPSKLIQRFNMMLAVGFYGYSLSGFRISSIFLIAFLNLLRRPCSFCFLVFKYDESNELQQ